MNGRGPWRKHALQWSRVGPPLRPSPEDVAVAREALDDWRAASGRDDPTLLLLGVTPELCALATGWRSRVVAVDRSVDMIRSVWPGRLRPRDEALCADWLRLPLAGESVDLVLSDGCLSTLPYPRGYAAVCAELLRVLREGGRCVARCFVLPEKPERLEDVLADLGAGRTRGFHAFKWRLAMALHRDPEEGVCVDDVWRVWDTAGREAYAARAAHRRWAPDVVATIEAYRGLSVRLCFPTPERILDAVGGHLRLLDREVPGYELGDRCPTLVFGAAAT